VVLVATPLSLGVDPFGVFGQTVVLFHGIGPSACLALIQVTVAHHRVLVELGQWLLDAALKAGLHGQNGISSSGS
jgi:hypothetical protein